jgi:hypothetical protein
MHRWIDRWMDGQKGKIVSKVESKVREGGERSASREDDGERLPTCRYSAMHSRRRKALTRARPCTYQQQRPLKESAKGDDEKVRPDADGERESLRAIVCRPRC